MPGLKLMAELGLDGSGFASGFRKARGLAEGAGLGLKNMVIGAIGIGTVEEAIRRTVESAKELVETSERLSIAPEQLQVMRQAARQSGVEFEKLAEAMEKINIARERALIPGQEGFAARRAFGAAGIGVEQLRSLQPLDLLRQIASSGNVQQTGIIFQELGFKGFGQLIPMLTTNFEELRHKMEDMGMIMDTKAMVALEGLSKEATMLSQIITAQLGPALIKLAEFLYSTMLKGGGGLAGGSAALGAMTANQSFWDNVTSGISLAGHSIARAVGFIDKAEYERLVAPLFDWNAGKDAIGPAQDPWKKREEALAAFLAKMAKDADDLNHPKTPHFTEPTLHERLPRKALEAPSDSLVRIGNFLGGRTDMTIQRRVQLLQSMDQSLKAVRNLLQKLPGGDRINWGPNFPHF